MATDFKARVIPDSLVDVVLHLGHNQSGHNGLSEDICSNQAFVLLRMRMQILQMLQGLYSTKSAENTV